VSTTPEPPQHGIDRILWGLVISRTGYLQLVVTSSLVVPLILGFVLPPTPGWTAAYVLACVACGVMTAVVQRSRDRWLDWYDWTLARRCANRKMRDVATGSAVGSPPGSSRSWLDGR
jgi:hypothetical protein